MIIVHSFRDKEVLLQKLRPIESICDCTRDFLMQRVLTSQHVQRRRTRGKTLRLWRCSGRQREMHSWGGVLHGYGVP